MAENTERIEVPVLRVTQWLSLWDSVQYSPELHRERPAPHFVLFSMSARRLRALADIKRRSATQPRSQDTGIQRRLEPDRSEEIARFTQYGFPWSNLSRAKRNSGDYNDLRKPGWLPTAIVVNIRGDRDRRSGKLMQVEDRIDVEIGEVLGRLLLPKGFHDANWRPSQFSPLEVIDGQHRLWAFEKGTNEDMELPVVGFLDLDISWQAYLFWTINIKPKKINASLAYDLYPLLRTEDWLEKFEGHPVYRESRAQELTEALWSHPASPWHHRINMLGEGRKGVTQAAWIRALLATYVRHYGRGRRIGGLFGAPPRENATVLPWTRAQQAAFLISAWTCLQESIAGKDDGWAADLRSEQTEDDDAFEGQFSLLNTDQGVRGFLSVSNDMCFVKADVLGLENWLPDELPSGGTDEEAISAALESLVAHPVYLFLQELAESLAEFDWRTAGAPGLPDPEKSEKLAFRGTGGYRELRNRLLAHLQRTPGKIADDALTVAVGLGLTQR